MKEILRANMSDREQRGAQSQSWDADRRQMADMNAMMMKAMSEFSAKVDQRFDSVEAQAKATAETIIKSPKHHWQKNHLREPRHLVDFKRLLWDLRTHVDSPLWGPRTHADQTTSPELQVYSKEARRID